jgi:hypothetical protein
VGEGSGSRKSDTRLVDAHRRSDGGRRTGRVEKGPALTKTRMRLESEVRHSGGMSEDNGQKQRKTRTKTLHLKDKQDTCE